MKAVLRYLGAKNRLADWIVPFFPEHKIYVEPYGGSAAVLLNKAPVEIEVYNDLYDDVVNLFRVIRSERYVELMELVNMTPFSERRICAKNGDFDRYKAGAIAYAWFYWIKNHRRDCIIKWL